jgi:hypothetical protein
LCGTKTVQKLYIFIIRFHVGHIFIKDGKLVKGLPNEVMAEVEEHGTVWVYGAVVEYRQGEVL